MIKRATWALGGILVLLPACAFVFLSLRPDLDPKLVSPGGHFYIVSTVALGCLALAIPAAMAAARMADVRLLALALTFLSVAGFFSVHGIATPGFLVGGGTSEAHGAPPSAPSGHAADAPEAGEYGPAASTDIQVSAPQSPVAQHGRYGEVVGLSARLSLLAGAFFLAASAVNWSESFVRRIVPRVWLVLGAWALVLVAYVFVALGFPEVLPPDILKKDIFLQGTLVLVLGATAFAAWRYLEGFRRSGVFVQGAAALAAMLMFEAQVSMHFGSAWHASWWMYHGELLGGFGVLVGAVLTEYARGGGAVRAFEEMTLPEALSHIEAGYSDSIRALAASLETRDPYTHGHGRRVAGLAFHLGQELGLSGRRLRAVVQGALLHDLGKIGVPDSILLKPAKLTPDEFEFIKEHPAAGERLMMTVSHGVIERSVIRHHHEWFDGSGYPDGLRGEELPLEVRIATVADVYDALRSNRAYRGAMTREQALELMRSEVGTHFDPLCIEALERVVDRFELDFEPERSEQLSETSGLEEHWSARGWRVVR